MKTKSKMVYGVFVLAGILFASAVVVFVLRYWQIKSREKEDLKQVESSVLGEDPSLKQSQTVHEDDGEGDEKEGEEKGIRMADPSILVEKIAKVMEQGDMALLEKYLGKQAVEDAVKAQLHHLLTKNLGKPIQIRQVGEAELNAVRRWELTAASGEKLVLDVGRGGKLWSIKRLQIAGADSVPDGDDALGALDAFLQAVLHQQFDIARQWVDAKQVSDAKIAGLCIIFEEGKYRLRQTKSLRAMYQKEKAAGYFVHVESDDGKEVAKFAIALRQVGDKPKWQISEVNLDDLLGDYAQRVAGGDVYYSPLVKNPNGGDTVALYFEFDEDAMSARTQRQLQIVSQMLKADAGKKITLSGHTDSVGTDQYNYGLSTRRAEAVREYMMAAGVPAAQIELVSKGATQPRRPNLTEKGLDNPTGRKVNRRTEIYLDF